MEHLHVLAQRFSPRFSFYLFFSRASLLRMSFTAFQWSVCSFRFLILSSCSYSLTPLPQLPTLPSSKFHHFFSFFPLLISPLTTPPYHSFHPSIHSVNFVIDLIQRHRPLTYPSPPTLIPTSIQLPPLVPLPSPPTFSPTPPPLFSPEYSHPLPTTHPPTPFSLYAPHPSSHSHSNPLAPLPHP